MPKYLLATRLDDFLRKTYGGSASAMSIEKRPPSRKPVKLRGDVQNTFITQDTVRVTGLVRRVFELDRNMPGTLAHHTYWLEHSPIPYGLERDKSNGAAGRA